MKARNPMVWMILFFWMVAGFKAEAQKDSASIKLSFEQALQITRQNSHVLKEVGYLQEEKDQEAKAAKGLHSPKIGLSANYLLMSDDITMDLSPVKTALEPLYLAAIHNSGAYVGYPNLDPATQTVVPTLTDAQTRQFMGSALTTIDKQDWNQMIQKKQFGTVNATVQWPIFTGGKINAANKAAEIEQKDVADVLSQKEGELISELAERYFGLCLARQAVLVRKDVLDGLNQHLQDAIKIEEQGLIPNADVLHAKVYFAQAQREYSKAKRTADILNQALVNTLALQNDSTIIPVSNLFYLDAIEPKDHFIAMAKDRNPLLRQVESKKQLAEQGYKAEKSNYFPTVAAIGSYTLVDKNLSPYAPNWMAGVGLNWTLFDGTARSRKIKSAALKRQQVEEIEEKAQNDIETGINKLYEELNMYHEQLQELESALTSAKEYVRVREKAFHDEMSNSTEVVDARLALSQVRIERLQAMYGYDTTLSKLLQLSGNPDEFTIYQQRNDAKFENYNSEK
ncbi:MAG: TolC family protein [Bacteroidota bacterium]|nr:TolC family protein [Bacteroidota bacterium]